MTTVLALASVVPLAPARAPDRFVRNASPPPYQIDLKPTDRVHGASGVVKLLPAQSPFGTSVSSDGHYVIDAEVSATGLPEPGALGDFQAYVVWVAELDLSRTLPMATLDAALQASGRVSDMNKFMVFISAEASPDVLAPRGPVVLRGISPSALMQNMLAEPLTNGGMPKW